MLARLAVAVMLLGQGSGSPAKPTAETVHPFEVKAEFDRVRGYTSTSARFEDAIVEGDEELSTDLRIYHSFQGQKRAAVEDDAKVHLLFTSVSKTWTYLRTHGVVVLADDTRIRPSENRHDGTIKTGFVVESISGEITFAELKKMAGANSVDVALGIKDFSLTKQQIAALQDLVGRLSVDSDDAEGVAAEHALLYRQRMSEMQAKMDDAVAAARKAVDKLPRSKRAANANLVGIGTLLKEFRPTAARYRPTPKETKQLMSAYPEFNDAIPAD